MDGSETAAPEGYRSVTPYLAVDGAARAIGFYAEAFGARERMRLDAPGGKVGHAELEIGDAVLMLADPWPGGAFEAPRGETASVSIHLYVADADAVFARAVAAGATALRPVETPVSCFRPNHPDARMAHTLRKTAKRSAHLSPPCFMLAHPKCGG